MLPFTDKSMVVIGGSSEVARLGDRMLSRALNALASADATITRAMKIRLVLAIITIGLIGIPAPLSRAADTTVDRMPAEIETQFALSALPAAMREHATLYLLDPQSGYQLSRYGTSGVTCLVERTAWEQADFRNDYVPLCYDAVGTKTFLKVIMDVATLRIKGMGPVALKAEIETRYKDKTYNIPEKAGVSYMIAPIMRTWMLPDWNVHTMPIPHLMFYAPNVTNEDIGALPDSSLLYPFIFKEGLAEQSYMIQLIGEAEKARILADGKALLDDLCAYRDVLCLQAKKH